MNEIQRDYNYYIFRSLLESRYYDVIGHEKTPTPLNIRIETDANNGPEIIAECSSCKGILVANLVEETFVHK